MNFLFTCGGTAGHINPALAIAGRIRELMPDAKILFVGADGQMETRRVPEAGFDMETITITNIQRSFKLDKIVHNIKTVKNILLSGSQSKKIIKKFKPDVALGTGGYVCYPVLKAAHDLNIPCALHESNAVPGLTTRMLSSKVDRLLLGFSEGMNQYKTEVSITGTPVRIDFPDCNDTQAKAKAGFLPDMPLVLSVWGSLGSTHMNNMMSELIPMLRQKPGFQLVHAVGEREYSDLLARLGGEENLPENVFVRDYIHDMHNIMAAADLVLCRAGASTLSEIELMGKPAVLVPSPNVTNNHQEKNARVLEKAGGAKVLLEGEFDAQALFTLVNNLLADEMELKRMSDRMKKLAVPDSADMITDIVLGLAENKG